MSGTVNFTDAVDRDLLKRAKIVAAKCDTSVNALLNVQLRSLVETFERAERDRNADYITLLGFSLGALSADEVMRTLNLDSEEDLFLLMAQADLPIPRLPQAETDIMIKALRGLDGTDR
jgi:surfactin synthase thioesterase subunit